jgi:hypothetical protein
MNKAQVTLCRSKRRNTGQIILVGRLCRQNVRHVSICVHTRCKRGEGMRNTLRTNTTMTTNTTLLESMNKERNLSFENGDRLDTWKEIASYLNRNVRTVQRWEAFESMPVHRHLHAKSGSIHAFRSELDAWQSGRSYCRPSGCDQPGSSQCSEKALIKTEEPALLRTVLEAILVELRTQTASAMSSVPRPRRCRAINSQDDWRALKGARLQGTFHGNRH